jgi:hypothetical protein
MCLPCCLKIFRDTSKANKFRYDIIPYCGFAVDQLLCCSICLNECHICLLPMYAVSCLLWRHKFEKDHGEINWLDCVGIYPPIRISKDMYVILLSCGSRRMDSGVLGPDGENTHNIHESINFCFSVNCPLNCVHST